MLFQLRKDSDLDQPSASATTKFTCQIKFTWAYILIWADFLHKNNEKCLLNPNISFI